MGKTAREGFEFIISSVEAGTADMMVPLMVQFLIKHFEADKDIDDVLLCE